MSVSNSAKRKADSVKTDKKGKMLRHDTEAGHPLVQQKVMQASNGLKIRKEEESDSPQKTDKINRFLKTGEVNESTVTVVKPAKVTLHIKQLSKTLWQMK